MRRLAEQPTDLIFIGIDFLKALPRRGFKVVNSHTYIIYKINYFTLYVLVVSIRLR